MPQNILLGNAAPAPAALDRVERYLTLIGQTTGDGGSPGAPGLGAQIGLDRRGRRTLSRSDRTRVRCRLHRTARLRIDLGQAASHRHHIAFEGKDFDHHPGQRRGNLGINLVGRHLDQRLIDLDPIPHDHQPAGNRTLDHAFAQCGEFDGRSHDPTPLRLPSSTSTSFFVATTGYALYAFAAPRLPNLHPQLG